MSLAHTEQARKGGQLRESAQTIRTGRCPVVVCTPPHPAHSMCELSLKCDKQAIFRSKYESTERNGIRVLPARRGRYVSPSLPVLDFLYGYINRRLSHRYRDRAPIVLGLPGRKDSRAHIVLVRRKKAAHFAIATRGISIAHLLL